MKPTPILVYSASPDDPLDAETAAALLGICVDSAYELAKLIPSFKIPGVGVRFRRSDVMAYLYRQEHLRPPRGGKSNRKTGTLRASGKPREVVPGLDSEELRKRAGF